LDDLMSTVTTY